MDDAELGGYAELPARISEIGARLQSRADAELAADLARLLTLVEDFHRIGLTPLVAMIQQWRGEIFLEAVEREPIAGTLLRSYGLPTRNPPGSPPSVRPPIRGGHTRERGNPGVRYRPG